MNTYNLVFWVYDLNLLLFDLLKELDRRSKILVVAENKLDKNRIKDGWYIPAMQEINTIISPNISEIKNTIESNLNSVHLFYGINSFKMVHAGFKYAINKKVRIGVFTESGLNLGFKGKLRKIKSLTDSFRYEKYVDFILPMGYLGVKWYRSSFYPTYKIFPFLYVVENQEFKIGEPLKSESNDRVINIIVVAQCIKRKNIDLLLKALATLKDENWELKIIGEGTYKTALQNLTKRLRLENKVAFLGTVPNKDVRTHFLNADLSILPSKWDGWGAVINESLMSGVPVICSDKCGASCLISGDRGAIFKSNSKKSLEGTLAKWIEKGKTNLKTKGSIKTWSNCIAASYVSNYIFDVIDYVYSKNKRDRPIEPWIN